MIERLRSLKIENPETPFTVSEIQQIIKVVFQRRNTLVNYSYSSGYLKHFFENIGRQVCGQHKYCLRATAEAAFKESGFISETKRGFEYYNISKLDVRPLEKLFNR